MSCFIVSDLHVDLLVDVAFHGPRDAGRAWGPRLEWTAAHWQGSYPRESYRLEAAAADEEAPAYFNPDTLGRLLVEANHRGYMARYPQTSATILLHDYSGSSPSSEYVDRIQFEVARYRFVRRPYRLSTVEALKAVACLRYQCCDHPDYEESIAGRFLSALRKTLVYVLPGMEAAPWEWTPEALADVPEELRSNPVDIFAL